MRPVLLDMEGFAAFREKTNVDFRGADYFVLVGPTGSGKSTVLDAISFALYGTVPRWEDRRKVALALAPTAARGTVRLVFDCAGARYQVARELRRSGGATKQVSIKNARLERLVDLAGIGDVDDPTELLAADSAVNDAIVSLLGLSFDHFCKCVSLPQGAFAEFLHAKPSDRDDILGDLLGLGVYETIGRRAREEAASHRATVATLTDQLTSFADATAEAEQDAAARVTVLSDLTAVVDGAVPQLKKVTAAVNVEAERAAQLAADARQLADVVTPGGLDGLAGRVEGAAVRHTAAQTELAEADAADTAARETRRAAPDRSPLEESARHHQDLADAHTSEPAHAAALTQARQAATEAQDATRTAGVAEAAARRARDDAAGRHRDAAALVERLTGELDALTNVTSPDGVDELAAEAAAAGQERRDAQAALTAAEAAEEQARAAVRQAAGRRVGLQQAARDFAELAPLEAAQPELDARHQAASNAAAAASAELEASRTHLEHTQDGFDQVTRSDAGAALRLALAVGDDCPVCDQPVQVLPPRLPADALGEAKQLLDAAKTRLADAGTAASSAERAAGRLGDERQRHVSRIAELREQLTGMPSSAAAVAEELAAIDALTTAETEAGTARQGARIRLADADTAFDKVTAAQQAAARLLAQARDPLIALALDAPPAGDDVAVSWQQLHTWAKELATSRRRELTGAQTAAEREAVALAIAETDFSTAQTAAAAARQSELAASGIAERAKAEHDAVVRLIDRLTGLLAGRPDAEETWTELARLDELDTACRQAEERVRTARTAVDDTQEQLTGLRREVDAGWRQLRAARDPLVRFDAPEPSGDDLRAAWIQLSGWAAQQSQAHDVRARASQAQLTELERSRDAAAAELADSLGEAGINVRDDLPLADTAPVAVAKAAAEAAAAVSRITERRTEAATLEQRRSGAERDQQVAGHLGLLLRTDNFPRWLAASALNTLLMEASASLLELSGGQFELTHDGAGGGDLLIVDHADADFHRPVKTLSGGETFQASLALALALSSQMATLAEAGAVRLDSIFLDEGFGTLDEATLEIVADTLETLAGQKERMVGVITHVPALAERIPVKFNVARDQSSSRVTRSDA